LTNQLRAQDDYLLLADYRSYLDCQQQVDLAYTDRPAWIKKSILNVARSGKFSSDRAIREYADQIWHIKLKG
jgi:glycogen phosphorylase